MTTNAQQQLTIIAEESWIMICQLHCIPSWSSNALQEVVSHACFSQPPGLTKVSSGFICQACLHVDAFCLSNAVMPTRHSRIYNINAGAQQNHLLSLVA